MKIRVLIVDDHQITCDVLAALLQSQPDLEVVGIAESGEKALELVAELSPDIVTMDMGLPGMDGIEATRRIRTEFPKVRVLGLSMHLEPDYISRAIQAGAADYLFKMEGARRLFASIRAIVGKQRADDQLEP